MGLGKRLSDGRFMFDSRSNINPIGSIWVMCILYTYTVCCVQTTHLESGCFLVSCYRCETMLPLKLLICFVVVVLRIGVGRLNITNFWK